MKTTLAILAAILTAAGIILAADNVTSNYYSGAVTVLATSTNVGDTGLSTNVNYIAIPLTSLTGVTTGNVTDVRAVLYGAMQAFYVARTASTNPTTSAIARDARYDLSGTNVIETVTHVLRTYRTASAFELQ